MDYTSIKKVILCLCGLVLLTTQCYSIEEEDYYDEEVPYCDPSEERKDKSVYLEMEKECPTPGAKALPRISIGWEHPERAWLTIPPEVVVKNSNVPKGGLGVFAKTFIPAHTWLGEYQGQFMSGNYTGANYYYAWASFCNSTVRKLIDGKDIARSNWLRWVNCPRIPLEENVKVKKCFQSVYYITSRLIRPGEELMVYYGDDYAAKLGIDTHQFKHGWGLISGSKPETSPSPLEKKLRQQNIFVQVIMKTLHISKEEAIKALKKHDNDMEKTIMDLLLRDLQDFKVEDIADNKMKQMAY